MAHPLLQILRWERRGWRCPPLSCSSHPRKKTSCWDLLWKMFAYPTAGYGTGMAIHPPWHCPPSGLPTTHSPEPSALCRGQQLCSPHLPRAQPSSWFPATRESQHPPKATRQHLAGGVTAPVNLGHTVYSWCFSFLEGMKLYRLPACSRSVKFFL